MLRAVAFIFLAYLVIIPFLCLFSSLSKNDEEEEEVTIGDWCVKLSEDRVLFQKMVEPYMLSEVEIIIVDDSLDFTVKVFGSYLVADYPLYLRYCRTMCNVTLSNLV